MFAFRCVCFSDVSTFFEQAEGLHQSFAVGFSRVVDIRAVKGDAIGQVGDQDQENNENRKAQRSQGTFDHKMARGDEQRCASEKQEIDKGLRSRLFDGDARDEDRSEGVQSQDPHQADGELSLVQGRHEKRDQRSDHQNDESRSEPG